MKTMLRNLLVVLAIVGWASAAPAEVIFTETFSYPNGNLATAPPVGGVSGGLWVRSGTTSVIGNVAVSDGKVTLHQRQIQNHPFNPQGEDVIRGFSAPTPGETIYAGLDVSASGGSATVGFGSLGLFITPPLSGGDFTFGIGEYQGFAPITISWPGGLSFNTTYRTVLSYEPNTGIKKLWVNPVDQSSTSISFTHSTAGPVSYLSLAQGFTGLTPTPASRQVIDNIVVGTSFNDVLAVPASALGDYNNDGAVDAADYIVWRKTAGTQADYDTWRANFGETLGSGAGATTNTSVPEPATLVMLIVAAVGVSTLRRCRTWPVSKLNNM